MLNKKLDSADYHKTPYGMRLVCLALILFSLVALSATHLVYAQTTLGFGYQLHPEKPLENTEAILQLHATSGGSIISKEINDLSAISSDSKIVQVLGIEQTDQHTTNVKIKTLKTGTANIIVAAPGFDSQEIPVTVYTSNNNPTQLSMKITPNDFAVDSPKFGYVSVELLTTGGLPTRATSDTTIKLFSPNSDVIELADTELVIQQGKYFAVGQFKVKNSGDALVFAEAEGMKKISETLHVRKVAEPLTLKLYVYPQQYLSLTNNIGYAIVQLEDGEGIPVKTTKDIKVKIVVDKPAATKNVSSYTEEIKFDSNELTIKAGTYSAYTTFIPRPDFSGLGDTGAASSTTDTQAVSKTFNINLSAEGYVTAGNTITVAHGLGAGELSGNGPALIGSVPFLTTGNTEVIGVAYLQTAVEQIVKKSDGTTSTETVTVPVMAKENFKMDMSSSDLKTVSVIDPIFQNGKNAAIILGNTGTMVSEESPVITYEDNEGIKTFTPDAKGPKEDKLSLVITSLVDEILVGEEFPILAYMSISGGDDEKTASTASGEKTEEDSRQGPTRFVADGVLVFKADEIVEVAPQYVKQNQPYLLFNGKAKEVGTTTLSGSGIGFDAGLSVTSKTTDPTKIYLAHAGTAFPGTESLATIQLFDSADNPVFLTKDVEVKLIADKNNIIEIPTSVTIKAGQYFTTFKIKAIQDGNVVVSTLAENFPLEKFEIKVESLASSVSLTAPDLVRPNEDFIGQLSLSFAEPGMALSNYNVQWNVEGAEITRMDSVTDETGIARIVLVASDAPTISLSASVTGPGVSLSSAAKQISVNQTSSAQIEEVKQEPGMLGLSVAGIDIVYLIIPAAAGGAIFFLKKTGRLEGMMEKIKLGGLIDTVKEKLPSRS